jgi:alpha-ketoglutarate-dependent 2,4-dichlorophenoxyacetate dioxygenase
MTQAPQLRALGAALGWHTDSTFEDTLPLLAMLHAKGVPSEKGGTMFADMRAAYDALPEAQKQRLSGLTGLHGRTEGPAGDYRPDERRIMLRTIVYPN